MGMRKGAWSQGEDTLLRRCIENYGEGKWHLVPTRAGLSRCRKSCRLRWLNYLKPDIKRGEFEEDEIDLIFRMHRLLGNRWALIAGRIPGRTANDIKNYWNSHLSKKLVQNASCTNIRMDGGNLGMNKRVIKKTSIRKSIKENKTASSNERINPPIASPEEKSGNIIFKPRPLILSASFVYQDKSNSPIDVSPSRSNLETGSDEGVGHPTPSNKELWWKALLYNGDGCKGNQDEVPRSPSRAHDDAEVIGGIEMEYGAWSLDTDTLWRLISD